MTRLGHHSGFALSELMDNVRCGGFNQSNILVTSRNGFIAMDFPSVFRIGPDTTFPTGYHYGFVGQTFVDGSGPDTTGGTAGWAYPDGYPDDTVILNGDGFGEINGIHYTGPTYDGNPAPLAPRSQKCIAAAAATILGSPSVILNYIAKNEGKYGAGVISSVNFFKTDRVALDPLAFIEGLEALLISADFPFLLTLAVVGVAVRATWLACYGGL